LGDRKIIAVLFGLMLILVVPLTLDDSVFADKKGEKNTTEIIHLGYLQLAAHDFFNMNRCLDFEGNSIPDCEVKDSENGKLDASTVLFHPQGGLCDFKKSLAEEKGCALYSVEQIKKGGEIRSSENIMILTAGALVGDKYLKLIEKHSEEKAYKKTLKYYHKQLKKAYEESFDLKFPKPQKGEVTNLHNLAVRAGHDFLPAEIMFNGEMTSLFAIPPLGEKLSEDEKLQPSSPVDGNFDDVFTEIDFCPVELRGFCIKVDLLLADQSFGEQFAFGKKMDGDTFDKFMKELEDGKFDKKDKVSKLLDEAFSRGINLK
jgi:hypothetical protein